MSQPKNMSSIEIIEKASHSQFPTFKSYKFT